MGMCNPVAAYASLDENSGNTPTRCCDHVDTLRCAALRATQIVGLPLGILAALSLGETAATLSGVLFLRGIIECGLLLCDRVEVGPCPASKIPAYSRLFIQELFALLGTSQILPGWAVGLSAIGGAIWPFTVEPRLETCLTRSLPSGAQSV